MKCKKKPVLVLLGLLVAFMVTNTGEVYGRGITCNSISDHVSSIFKTNVHGMDK